MENRIISQSQSRFQPHTPFIAPQATSERRCGQERRKDSFVFRDEETERRGFFQRRQHSRHA
ncbi:MAG: hypothetical protein HQL52_10185 [Magnetococcales bacterium]|nr:hypothetical protein [Magnetococcales bacterium]